jgi:outer membrane protein OmpA-like peptidoglycan-associated protein
MRLALAAAAFAALVFPVAALAQDEAPPAEPGKDHPLLKRYPGAVMTTFDEKEFEEFQLTVGEKDGEAVTQPVEGAFFHAEYQFPLKTSCTQVIRNYENAFKSAGLTMHKGKLSPVGVGGWGSEDRWVSAEGAIKGKGGKVSILVTCNEYSDAASNNAGHAYVIVAKEMEQKIELDASAMEDEISKSGRVALYGINFATGKADITPDSAKTLEEVGKLLAKKPDWKLRVEGHTDNVGAAKANLDLSKKRAAAVKEHLVSKYKVKATQLVTEGFGDTKPLAPNDSDANKAKNRRVELVKL